VSGIRASLNASASIKRNSIAIVEAVSAEDIGKLPDVSIADSLARLPGVTAPAPGRARPAPVDPRPWPGFLDHAAQRPRTGHRG
jgi:hypothetical protein